ncbi:hypothetical protein PRK78_007106 [Emydomyces testavorans]|uniref:Pre-mRNA splicing factor CLF1 n=1 Tax=Emydomyces testavorans TaxID=2070801 RepID=A0AAF0IL50_9EURO|nr:hypothetical protein PRK78_007106 [Emydomyces testavorans]
MSFPKPPVDFEGHCSIIFNNTLYVYTPTTFQSLPLTRNATWKELPMGQPVEGATCVKGSVDGKPNNLGFYVVGGKSTSSDYLGLQRYSFADGKWESIFPATKDVQNRVDHASLYLNASASLLVYAGSQDGNTNPSTQSFLISVTPPFNVQSYNSYVPPAFRPMLLPWSEDKAVMIGGGPQNTKLFSFSAAEGWRDTGAELANALPEKSKVQCAIVSGADGSRILEIFDMSVSPNSVNRFALLMPGGAPAPPGRAVGTGPSVNLDSKPALKGQKRDIDLANYPPYNHTFAPTTIRNGFSLAQDANGLVVISGGNKQDPLAIFDQSTNSWLNATEFFVGTAKSVSLSSTPTPSSTSSSPTEVVSTPTATSSGLLSGDKDGSNRRTLTIIGTTLGVLLGVSALVIIILLVLWWKKHKNKSSGLGESKRRSSDDDFGFRDQGMEPLTRSVQPMARGPVPSADSWAIVTGQTDEHLSKPPFASLNSPASGSSIIGRSPLRNVEAHPSDSTIVPLTKSRAPVMESPVNDGQRLTDEGWSKYFQGDTHISGYGNGSLRSTFSSQETKSDYRDSLWPHSSAEIPALSIGIPRGSQPLGQVTSGSPNTAHNPALGTLVAQHGLKAKISSGDSISIASDDYFDEGADTPSSHISPDTREDSTMMAFGSSLREERVPSSTYSASSYQPNDSDSFVAAGQSDRPPTQWPREVHGSQFSGKRAPSTQLSSDISWLNLGKNR